MRRHDKKQNIAKVNLLSEQVYLKSKGLIKENDGEDYETTSREVEYGINPYQEQPDMGAEPTAKDIIDVIVDFSYKRHLIAFKSNTEPGIPIVDFRLSRDEDDLSKILISKFPSVFDENEYQRGTGAFFENIFKKLGDNVVYYSYGFDSRSPEPYFEKALGLAKEQNAKLVVMHYLS
jgi:hypothetical protein